MKRRQRSVQRIHSLFLAKHHIDGIVAMLEFSDVDNLCVCLKGISQFPLKRACVKVTLGLLRGWPYKKWTTYIQFTSTISTTPLVWGLAATVKNVL